jgi:hypothetical protein
VYCCCDFLFGCSKVNVVVCLDVIVVILLCIQSCFGFDVLNHITLQLDNQTSFP